MKEESELSAYQQAFRVQQAVVDHAMTTTMTYGRANGTLAGQYFPYRDKSAKDSALAAFAEAKTAENPEPRELAQIVAFHPYLQEMLIVVAKIVLRKYGSFDEWVRNLIPYTQATIWLALVNKPRVFQRALATPTQGFLGSSFLFLLHRCQQAGRELSGQTLWCKSLKSDQLSVIACEPIARGTDVMAVVLGDEVQLIIERYDDQTRAIIDYHVEGLKKNEIARKMGISRHQLRGAVAKLRARLSIDLELVTTPTPFPEAYGHD